MSMRSIITVSILLLFNPLGLFSQKDLPGFDQNWAQWRGPYDTGEAPAGNPPLDWSEETNIKWKSEIPGIGHATPIIWEESIILLSAVKTDKKGEPREGGSQDQRMSPNTTEFIHKFMVISVNRNSGEIEWQTTVREELPYSATHQFGSWASNSPVTDGEHIYAYFGSHGLYCLNGRGEILWERDLGRMNKVMSFGEGSSPLLYKDKLVVLRDHQGQSALHVLDKHNGETIWELKRDEPSSWSTPAVVEFGGKTQLITSATNRIRSYEMETGRLIWECGGMTRNVIPSPVYSDGLVYLGSGYRGSALLAVDLSKASGDITDTDAVAWRYDQNTPYTPSLLLMGGNLYFLKLNNGYLTCLDAKNGREYYGNQKLEGIQDIFTSPVGVKDRIYIVGTNGTCCVVRHGDTFELLSQNKLDDSFYASPVILGNDLYLRGVSSLYCISKQ